jgi:hypothetical protein
VIMSSQQLTFCGVTVFDPELSLAVYDCNSILVRPISLSCNDQCSNLRLLLSSWNFSRGMEKKRVTSLLKLTRCGDILVQPLLCALSFQLFETFFRYSFWLLVATAGENNPYFTVRGVVP